MLEIRGLTAAYGPSPVLHGVDLTIDEGACVTLMGRNGMGKTSTVRALMGLLPATGGSIRFRGRDLLGLPPHRIARLGLGLVPEGRQVFRTLSVHENLVATARPGSWSQQRVEALFPRLAERRGQMADRLSGGEQQMLAIGRALMTNPRLLILDEATEGLAPQMRAEIWNAIPRLRAAGQSVLLIDKHVGRLLDLADHHVILEKGRTVWSGTGAMLRAEGDAAHRWLGI